MKERRQRSGDIVIHNVSSLGTYIIKRVGGEQIGKSRDRLDAMRRACTAAEATGANVWIRVDGPGDTYHEVLCP